MSVPPPGGEPPYNIEINPSNDGTRLIADVRNIIINGKPCRFTVSCKVPEGKQPTDVEPKLRALVETKVKEILAASENSKLDMTGHKINVKISRTGTTITVDGKNYPVETGEKPVAPAEKLPESPSSSPEPAADEPKSHSLVTRFVGRTKGVVLLKPDVLYRPDDMLQNQFIENTNLSTLADILHNCPESKIPKIRYKHKLSKEEENLIKEGREGTEVLELRAGRIHDRLDVRKSSEEEELSHLILLILKKTSKVDTQDPESAKKICQTIRKHPVLFKIASKPPLLSEFIALTKKINKREKGGDEVQVSYQQTKSSLKEEDQRYIDELELQDMARVMSEISSNPKLIPKIREDQGELKLRAGAVGRTDVTRKKEELSALVSAIFTRLEKEVKDIDIPEIYPDKYKSERDLKTIETILFDLMDNMHFGKVVRENPELFDCLMNLLEARDAKARQVVEVLKTPMSLDQIIDHMIDSEKTEFRMEIFYTYRWILEDSKKVFESFCNGSDIGQRLFVAFLEKEKSEETFFDKFSEKLFNEFQLSEKDPKLYDQGRREFFKIFKNSNQGKKLDLELFKKFCKEKKTQVLDFFKEDSFKQFTSDLFSQISSQTTDFSGLSEDIKKCFKEFLAQNDLFDRESQAFFEKILEKYKAAQTEDQKEAIKNVCREWLQDSFVNCNLDDKEQPHLLSILNEMIPDDVKKFKQGGTQAVSPKSSSRTFSFGSLEQDLKKCSNRNAANYKKLVKEFSEELLALNDSLYAKCHVREFTKIAWQKNPKLAPNVDAAGKASTYLTNRINYLILNEPDITKRALLMSFFIDVANNLVDERRPYFAVAVMASFNSSAVHRLKKTKEKMPNESKRQLEFLDGYMNQFIGRLDGIKDATAQCPLNLLLSAFLFDSERNPIIWPNRPGFVSFKPIELFSNLYRLIKKPQGSIRRVAPLTHFDLVNNQKGSVLTDNECDTKSKELEPRKQVV